MSLSRETREKLKFATLVAVSLALNCTSNHFSMRDKSHALPPESETPIDDTFPIVQTDHFIFVSSVPVTGDMGGLSGADLLCEKLASSAGFDRPYMVYLSDSTISANERISIYGPVYNIAPPGENSPQPELIRIAQDSETFFSLDHENPILYTEKLELWPATCAVWTGTKATGKKNLPTIPHVNMCDDWTTEHFGGQNFAAVGFIGSIHHGQWSYQLFVQCNNPLFIYCISQ